MVSPFHTANGPLGSVFKRPGIFGMAEPFMRSARIPANGLVSGAAAERMTNPITNDYPDVIANLPRPTGRTASFSFDSHPKSSCGARFPWKLGYEPLPRTQRGLVSTAGNAMTAPW